MKYNVSSMTIDRIWV